MNRHLTAGYKAMQNGDETLYQFFCDLSGALVCTVKAAGNHEEALRQAWETEAKAHFSQCHRCGRWVSDPMYNAETWKCVQCSPWEEQPAFCPHCGESVMEDDVLCPCCHARLKYRETEGCG